MRPSRKRDDEKDGLSPAAFFAALSHWLVVFGLAVTAPAGLLAAAMNGVNGCPGAPFSLVFGYAAFFVSFLNVLSLPLLLVRVFVFVTSRHFSVPPLMCINQSLSASCARR
jgi:hypothetical protein